jgi:tripartite-type tricarboxylate transporter receptor subunit TctC
MNTVKATAGRMAKRSFENIDDFVKNLKLRSSVKPSCRRLFTRLITNGEDQRGETLKDLRRTLGLGILITIFFFAWSSIPTSMGKGAAQAADPKYPIKPPKLVVTFGTGGSTDIAARALAAPIQEFLGQPVVVVNIPGAGGAVGFDDVRKSDPDGYKMMMAAIGANVLVPAMNPKLHFKYDELLFVARTQINPNVIIVNTKSPWKDFKEFANALKGNPAKFKYATAGVGQVSHVGPILMMREIGLRDTLAAPVHYDSEGESVLALVRGDVDFCQVNLNSAVASLRGGRVQCLGVTTPERVESIKNVPTFKELGYPKFDIVGWRGICGPPNLPDYVVKKWEAAVEKTCQSPKWLKVAESLGDIPGYLDAKTFTAFVHDEFKKYRELFQSTGLIMK